MTLRTLRVALILLALAVLGSWNFDGSRAARGADLFYNYYAPSYVGGPPAQLYVSPRPTPPFVGHTYITYQPLMPHEFLYRHDRIYSRYQGGWRANRTFVLWW